MAPKRKRDSTQHDFPTNALSGAIAVVRVGKLDGHQVDFKAHAYLLRSASPFFDNALEGRFERSEDPVVRLPNHDPEVVGTAIKWIYTKTLDLGKDEQTWSFTGRLWLLAGELGLPELQNAAMRHMAAHWTDTTQSPSVVPETINYFYSMTSAKSPLRRVMSERQAWLGRRVSFELNSSRYCNAFKTDVACEQSMIIRDHVLVSNSKVKEPGFVTYVTPYLVKTE